MGPTIKIDTREQLPYRFTLPSEVGTLSVGDYSIVGLEDRISIERKELNDLIGCITGGRERFERELERSKAFDYFALVVEGSLSDIAKHLYTSQVAPKSVVQSLLAFSIRYRRLPIFFCESRGYAQRITESLLEKYFKETQKKMTFMEKVQRSQQV